GHQAELVLIERRPGIDRGFRGHVQREECKSTRGRCSQHLTSWQTYPIHGSADNIGESLARRREGERIYAEPYASQEAPREIASMQSHLPGPLRNRRRRPVRQHLLIVRTNRAHHLRRLCPQRLIDRTHDW